MFQAAYISIEQFTKGELLDTFLFTKSFFNCGIFTAIFYQIYGE